MKSKSSKRDQPFSVDWSKLLSIIYLAIKVIGTVIHLLGY